MSDEREAPVTDAEITDFIAGIVFFRDGGLTPASRYTFNYPAGEARKLERAKQSLETLASWARNGELVLEINQMASIVDRCLTAAVRRGGRVDLTFTGADLMALRPAVLMLDRFDLTKQRDERESRRSRNWRSR